MDRKKHEQVIQSYLCESLPRKLEEIIEALCKNNPR